MWSQNLLRRSDNGDLAVAWWSFSATCLVEDQGAVRSLDESNVFDYVEVLVMPGEALCLQLLVWYTFAMRKDTLCVTLLATETGIVRVHPCLTSSQTKESASSSH